MNDLKMGIPIEEKVRRQKEEMSVILCKFDWLSVWYSRAKDVDTLCVWGWNATSICFDACLLVSKRDRHVEYPTSTYFLHRANVICEIPGTTCFGLNWCFTAHNPWRTLYQPLYEIKAVWYHYRDGSDNTTCIITHTAKSALLFGKIYVSN